MLTPPELGDQAEGSLLGRTSPLVKLGLALAWLIGLATTMRTPPPLLLAATAIAAGLVLGRIPPRRLARALAPLVLAAVSIALANLIFSGSNTNPAATELARLGPFRITKEAAEAAFGLGARVMAIVAVGALFAQTTDPTRLVDALVQQGRLSARFAYGALAAYQAVPRLGEDLVTLRQARRIRGLGGSWHPRLLVGLLVRAIRHADQLALAMDARAFDSGPRSTYRPIAWGWRDVVIGISGVAVLVGALVSV
jgi:energy-coupling factor transport system permease protein